MSLFVLAAAGFAAIWSVSRMIASERQVRVAQMEIDQLQRQAAERRRQLSQDTPRV